MFSTKKLSTEDFIHRAKTFHNNKYDYSLVVYKNMSTKVIIICPVHGKFLQTPQQHLRSSGCSKCSGYFQLCKETFIEKAIQVHGDKYDYSKVVYITNKTKVIIICSIHGEFQQRPDCHLRGVGCPKCYTKNAKDNIQSFISKSINTHGYKYDYSKVDYKSANTKVYIICPIHGKFLQLPSNHIAGQGCPKCQQSNGEFQIEIWLKNKNLLFVPQ